MGGAPDTLEQLIPNNRYGQVLIAAKGNFGPTGEVATSEKEDPEYARLKAQHDWYKVYNPDWDFFLAAYEGGHDFANVHHLFRHARENQVDFEDRAKRLHYVNYCSQLVDFFPNFIFAETIDRTDKDNQKFFNNFIQDVDRRGSTVDEYMREVAINTHVFGMCYTLVDAPTAAEGRVITKQDEQDLSMAPYWVMILPREVLDWSVDQFDNLTYVKRCECIYSVTATGSTKKVERYTEFYPDRIDVTEVNVTNESEPEVGAKTSTKNQMGKVPILVHRFRRSKRYPFMGNSFLRDFAFNSREILNLTSLLQEFLYRQCFNILAREVDGNVPLTSQEDGDIGTSNMLEFPKGGTPPAYISPPSQPARFIQSERDRIKSEMFARAAEDVSGDLSNGTKASGFSQAQSFSKTVPFIASRADMLENAENALMTLTMERLSKKWTGRVKYKDRYEITNVMDAITQFTSLTRDVLMPSETFDKAQLTRLVKEFDGKLPPDVISKIEQEIAGMDYKKWKEIQEQALIGGGKAGQGISPAEQNKPKSSGTIQEIQAESKTPNTKATKEVNG